MTIAAPLLAADEFARRANAVYARLRPRLEPRRTGQIVAIEVETGDYFLGPTLLDAVRKARRKHPGKIFYCKKIGCRAVYTFKGYA